MQKLRNNSKLVLLAFVIVAVFLPQAANFLTWTIFPAVVLISALTLNNARFHTVGRENLKRIIKLIVINYVILGGLLAISSLFIDNPQWRIGMILLAIAPPAIGIIPLSNYMSRYPKDAASAEFLSYILALILVPVAIALMSHANVFIVINLMLAMIILPFVLAKIFAILDPKFLKNDSMITNFLYGLIIYVLIGSNIESFYQSSQLWVLLLIFVVVTFLIGAGFFVFLISRLEKEEDDSLYILFGTLKNGGFAGVLAFAFFSPVAAVPIAVAQLLYPYYIWFAETLLKRHHSHYRNHKHSHWKHAKL